jgi:uncharacterized protein YndB with AHSA1/START domain
MSSDRFEKSLVVRAPRARVWRAIADAAEFGIWFGAKFDGAFEPGRRIHGRMTQPPEYADLPFEMAIERIEPERLLAFRWHPGDVLPAADSTDDQMTLVEISLEDADGGTRVRVVESGFDRLPLDRRERAFRANEEGWAIQIQNIARHVTA